MHILKAENIYKTYKTADETLSILKGTNLEIEKGKTIAVTGESGSGKSTLLHILGLLDSFDKGKLFINGKPAPKNPDKAAYLRNEMIGFVFQFHYLLNDFTALENIAMPYYIKTKNMNKAKAIATDLIKQVGLFDRQNHLPSQLSGGEQQRIAIARALINKPAIIFADEPTGNLDPDHSNDIITLLMNINKNNNQTILTVTHNLEIANIMNEHYKLVNGVLVKQ